MEESYLNTNDGNNNNLKYEINYFYKLDSENNICFDCGGAFPCFVSINNGVFICKFCAENHKKNLNYNISYIYDINSELDKYLLSYITRGGNSRFKRLCNQYEVPCMSISQNDQEKINKYIIRLGEYHRLLLRSEINCSEPPPPLYREVAHNLIDVNIIYFPEFENYTLFRGSNISSNKNSNNNTDESMSSKIWEGTKTTLNMMKTTSGIIYNTSKPIVSFLGNAAFTGLKFIGNSVWNYYTKNNENVEKKNNDNNTKANNNITEGNNIPMNNNYNNMNYDNNFINNGNNNFDNYNYNNDKNMNNNNINNFSYINMNNIENNNNFGNNNNYNYYQNNKNYLTNSNKYTIFTINEEKSTNNNINNKQNMQNNFYSKPMPKSNNDFTKNNKNQISNFYDKNSINNESINNITSYINNNNEINNFSKSKIELLNHKNIIANDKYIINKNFLNNNNFNNKIPDSTENRYNINNQDLPNNNYPNFSMLENNMKNDNIILNRNVPNIIGEERYQEKARYPIYQSTNLLNDNTFTPREFDDNN